MTNVDDFDQSDILDLFTEKMVKQIAPTSPQYIIHPNSLDDVLASGAPYLDSIEFIMNITGGSVTVTI